MAKYFELLRVRSVRKPRKDWQLRWWAAVDAARRKGLLTIPKQEERMIAKEGSPIWKKLAEGAGGFRDAIGEGEPPFAFGSGMGWKEVKSKELRVKSDNISETTKIAENTKTLREVSLSKKQVKEIIASAIEKVIPKKPLAMTIKFCLIFGFALSIFGEPFPPFDWGSGMGVMDVSQKEAIALGVITKEEIIQKRDELREREEHGTLPSMNENLSASFPAGHWSGDYAGFLREKFGDQVRHVQDQTTGNVMVRWQRCILHDMFERPEDIPLETRDIELLPSMWRNPSRVYDSHGRLVLELDALDGSIYRAVVDIKKDPNLKTFYRTLEPYETQTPSS